MLVKRHYENTPEFFTTPVVAGVEKNSGVLCAFYWINVSFKWRFSVLLICYTPMHDIS